MNLRDIEAFLAVVDSGSIIAAASKLNLTQPGVTRRVQNLEQRLGVTLLDRQLKPLKPTAAGRQAYALGRRVVGAVAEMTAGLGPDGEPAGEFRLGFTQPLSDLALLPSLAKLRSTYPKLTPRVVSGWSPGLIEQVQQGALDAAGVMRFSHATRDEALVWHRIGTERVLLVASRATKLAKRLSLQKIAEQEFVLSQHGCGLREEMRRVLDAERLPFHIAAEAAGVDLQLSLVEQGIGLGLITESALRKSGRQNDVQLLDVPAFRQDLEVWLVHRADTPRIDPSSKSLREVLAGALTSTKRAPARKQPRR
jgi:DNA-binding transcriptional LysR family regulator